MAKANLLKEKFERRLKTGFDKYEVRMEFLTPHGIRTLIDKAYENMEDALKELKKCVHVYYAWHDILWDKDQTDTFLFLWGINEERDTAECLFEDKDINLFNCSKRTVDDFFGTTEFSSEENPKWLEVPIVKDSLITLSISSEDNKTPIIDNVQWVFAEYMADDAEIKVNELVRSLVKSRLSGKILIQEFDWYENESYVVSVNQGEVCMNFFD